MARLLASVGTVSYNGFTFPAPFDAEVTAVPRMDSSNRYVKYVVYTITIATIIVPDDAPTSTAGAQVDDNLEDIRCRLLKSGGSFQFNNQGLGDNISVNNSGAGRLDVNFGPHPRILSWKPTGSNRACHVVWSVDVALPECCDTIISPSLAFVKSLEHNYTVSWDINEYGATTRIIQGRLEIPGYRTGVAAGAVQGPTGRTSLTNADKHWDRIFKTFLPVPGFLRESRRSLSQDRKTLEYVITDRELPSDNPLMPYMVKMEIDHQARIGFPNMFQCMNNISGSIYISPGAPRHWGWLAFAKVAFQRYIKGGSFTKEKKGGSAETTKKMFNLITELVWVESIYSREFRFSMSWKFGIGTVLDVFKGSGLFQPVHGASGLSSPQGSAISWAAWTVSMSAITNNARGLGQMVHNPANDVMIQICDDQPTINVNNLVKKNLSGTISFPTPDEVTKPSPAQSWERFEQAVIPILSTNVMRHRKLKNIQIKTATSKDVNPNATQFNLDNIVQEEDNADGVVEQARGPSATTFRLAGNAVRIGYAIALPSVKAIGGKTLKVLGVSASQKVIGNHFGMPVYAATWIIDYSLTGKPKGDLMTESEKAQ